MVGAGVVLVFLLLLALAALSGLVLNPLSLKLATRLVIGERISYLRALGLSLLVTAVHMVLMAAVGYALRSLYLGLLPTQLLSWTLMLLVAAQLFKLRLNVEFGRAFRIALVMSLFTVFALAAIVGTLYGVSVLV